MIVIEPNIDIIDRIDGKRILKKLETIGRVCYKSEELIKDDSDRVFIKKILESGHESVIEHESVSVRVVCDRGVSHEIVRHRIASYSQESTRYCNYSQDKFGNELTFIRPVFWEEGTEEYDLWKDAMKKSEDVYLKMISFGAKPQEARSVLPNSLKTEIVISMNMREWRHFFKLRTSKRAHPQMKQVADLVLERFKLDIPVLFDDI